jgi:UDP-glucoronosyl and UDP-glucosyl transferase
VIPFTGEHYRNGLRAERGHFGKMIQFDELNAETFLKTIKEVIDDKTYFTGVRQAANKFFARPNEPLREAIFWINHIAGNNGFDVRPKALFSPWYQFYGYDVLLFYFVILFICVLFWIMTIKLILSYRKKQERGKFKYY